MQVVHGREEKREDILVLLLRGSQKDWQRGKLHENQSFLCVRLLFVSYPGRCPVTSSLLSRE